MTQNKMVRTVEFTVYLTTLLRAWVRIARRGLLEPSTATYHRFP